MSTQRMLLMLFVTVAVAWMVGYAEGKHSADRWWQADEAKKAQTIRNWKITAGTDDDYDTDFAAVPCGTDFTKPCPKEQPKQ